MGSGWWTKTDALNRCVLRRVGILVRRSARTRGQRRARQQEVARRAAPHPTRDPQRRRALQAPRHRHDRGGWCFAEHPLRFVAEEVQEVWLGVPRILNLFSDFEFLAPRARKQNKPKKLLGVHSTPPREERMFHYAHYIIIINRSRHQAGWMAKRSTTLLLESLASLSRGNAVRTMYSTPLRPFWYGRAMPKNSNSATARVNRA